MLQMWTHSALQAVLEQLYKCHQNQLLAGQGKLREECLKNICPSQGKPKKISVSAKTNCSSKRILVSAKKCEMCNECHTSWPEQNQRPLWSLKERFMDCESPRVWMDPWMITAVAQALRPHICLAVFRGNCQHLRLCADHSGYKISVGLWRAITQITGWLWPLAHSSYRGPVERLERQTAGLPGPCQFAWSYLEVSSLYFRQWSDGPRHASDFKNRMGCKWNIKFQVKLEHKIWGFHGGDYEEWRLLGCYAVWLL
jgi:hypothetical protein